MGIEVLRAKIRASENGPPFSLFNAEKFHQYRIYNNHRFAMKIEDSEYLVLKRLRKKARKYTLNIFLGFLKCMCVASTYY